MEESVEGREQQGDWLDEEKSRESDWLNATKRS